MRGMRVCVWESQWDDFNDDFTSHVRLIEDVSFKIAVHRSNGGSLSRFRFAHEQLNSDCKSKFGQKWNLEYFDNWHLRLTLEYWYIYKPYPRLTFHVPLFVNIFLDDNLSRG